MECHCANHPGFKAALKSTPRALLKLMSKHLQISPLKKLPRPPGRGPIRVKQAASLCLNRTINSQNDKLLKEVTE